MTLGELKVLLCNLTPLVLDNMTISRFEVHSENSVIVPLNKSQNGMSLTELNFLDGDSIFAKNSYNEITNSKLITVKIENRCEISGESNIEFQQVDIEIDPEQCISDFIVLLKQKLLLDDTLTYRLRKTFDQHRRKPPLHQHLTLKEAGINDNTKLILEKGLSPKPHQITLMFSIGTMLNEAPSYELTVDCKISILRCFRLMLQLSGLEGESWHLRRSSWHGEPLDPLINENASLEEEGLKHGDCLIVIEGRLPPPGYLTFYIWLYETAEHIYSNESFVQLNSPQNEIKEIINGDMCGISHYYNFHPVQVGEVELSADCTLTDLKTQLLTLPKLSDFCLPGVRYMRLRIIEGKRLGRILRGHLATLRKLKLINHQVIGVQILSGEEDLLQSDILLNVHQRIPNIRAYTPPRELIWESGKGASIKSLCQLIGENLKIPFERLLIAKYFTETYEWKIINETGKHKVKKKWNTIRINLRQSPYFLKDGDIIGIKDIAFDSENKYDFNTPEDDVRKECLRIIPKMTELQLTEENQSLGSDETDTSISAPQEVGITIHVEDFN